MTGYWIIVGGIMLALAAASLVFRLMGARYR